MSAPQKKVNHRKPKQSYKSFVAKILKQKIDKDAGLSGDASAVASSMTAHLINEIAHQTKTLMTKDKKKTVQARDVQTAASTVLGRPSKTEIQVALEAFKQNKTGSKSERAELILPVARIQTMLRKQKVGSSVSPLAAVVLAAVVQGEIVHLFDVANQLRKNDKVVRVTAKHLKLAAVGEKHFAGVIKHGGVEEHIEEALVPKSKKRSASDSAPATKRAKK